MLDSLIQDVQYALRGIRRSPLFAASVAATIGVGLGILCSAFTLGNAYLFKAVDLPNPGELYELRWDTATRAGRGFRLADAEALADGNPMFAAIAAGNVVTAMRSGSTFRGRLVTGNYFYVLGAQPLLGRRLEPADAAERGAGAVVVLSYLAWQSHFEADASIVGKSVTLGTQRFEVIGVMKAGQVLPGDENIGFWAPLTMVDAFQRGNFWSDPDAQSLSVVGRLRRDATGAQARAWFDAWLRQRFPPGSPDAPVGVRVDSLATRIPVTRETLTFFTLFVAAFGLVLLMACANVTNMMLARGLLRQRELAVRLSLGATRARVIGQLLIESLVLSIPAVAIGLGLTWMTARVFPAAVLGSAPPGLPVSTVYLAPFDPDVRVFALLTIAAIAASAFVALGPALQLSRTSIVNASRGEVGIETRLSRLRTGLVMAQIAACALCLVATGGLASEAYRLARVDTGMQHERVIDVRVDDKQRARVAASLANEPSIEHVAVAWRPPLAGELRTVRVIPATGGVEQNAGFLVVSPEYFAVFDVALTRGRVFTNTEAEQDAAVVVVSGVTARLFWPGEDAVGKTLEMQPHPSDSERRPTARRVEVVGVVEDVFAGTLLDGIPPTTVYFPTSAAARGPMSLLVRGRGDASATAAAITASMERAMPEVGYQVFQMGQMLGLQIFAFELFASGAAIPAVVGLLFAFSGTYGVVAFLVARRARELGIRMALGATGRRIVTSMVSESARIAIVGTVVGLLLAVVLARFAASALEFVPVFGAGAYALGGGVVLIAALLAALLPSLGASRLDPSAALRAE